MRRAALMLLPALFLAACGSAGADEENTVTVAADPREAIAGTWYPQQIAGYTVDPAQADSYAQAYLTFGDGRIEGSDGCNQVSGTYQLGADGAFDLGELTSTRIGCANVPHQRALGEATRVEVTDAALVFSAADELARYARSKSPAPTGGETSSPAASIVAQKTEPEIPPGP